MCIKTGIGRIMPLHAGYASQYKDGHMRQDELSAFMRLERLTKGFV